MKTPFPRSLQRDTLRALQFAYYVQAFPLVDDYTFDMMEKAYEEATGEELPVGSDDVSGYTKAEQHMACYLKETLKP